MKFSPCVFLAVAGLPVILHSEAGPEEDVNFSHSVTTDNEGIPK